MSYKSARLLQQASESFTRRKTSWTSTIWHIKPIQSPFTTHHITCQSRNTFINWNNTSCRPFASTTITLLQRERSNGKKHRHRFSSRTFIRPVSSLTTRKNSSSTQSKVPPTLSNITKIADSESATEARIITTNDIDRRTIYELLKLSSFTNSELHWRFDQIIHAGDRLREHIHGPLHHVTTELVEEEEKLIAFQSVVDEASNGDNDNKDADKDGVKDSVRETMHIQDLEAYIYERYLHIDDQWNDQYRASSVIDAADDDDEQERRSHLHRIRQCAKTDAASIFQLLLEHVEDAPVNDAMITSTALTKDQFQQSVQTLASKVQYSTILPLATSMLLVGSSVGVISPIMPFLADKLDLTTTLYGIVVSSFALSKMLGNVPSAILVERHGRKPYLVHSLWAVGLGVAGMGLSSDWMQLSVCRMVIGLGVASLTTASTLTVADSSTPLSRARTFSPLMGAFAAGMAIGPAIGGMLCDTWGIQNTFFAVSSSYLVASIWNHFGVDETKRHGELWERKTLPWHCPDADEALSTLSQRSCNERTETVSIPNAVTDTTEQWRKLLADENVRPIVVMNGFYMSTFAAAQLTLLPLLFTGGGTTATGAATGLALSATAMGQIYMWMSINQVLSNPIAGRFADRSGKSAAIVAGGALTSLAVASVPVLCSFSPMGDSVLDWSNWPMLATLSLWSLGGTLLGTAHVAAVSDEVSESFRSQAIALLRTAGDVGYLCGAACAGISADLVGDVGLAMQAGGAMFLGATTWFGLKSAALKKL